MGRGRLAGSHRNPSELSGKPTMLNAPPSSSSWDPVCTETDEWQAAAGVAGLDPQPCYVVLGDERDWNGEAPPVADVPHERLVAPADPDTWLSVVKDADEAALENPLTYLLFLGPDERGDLVPTRALRERHGAARRDVVPPGGGGEGEDE